QLVQHVIGRAIPGVLPVVLDPSVDPQDASAIEDVSGHGLTIDRAVKWTIDFQAAEEAGMAVRIPLQPQDLATGFDQLIAVGIKGSLSPADAATRLAALLDSHHYTRGFSFVREGTPAHNTSATRSPVPSPDPGGEHSFPIEREGSLREP